MTQGKVWGSRVFAAIITFALVATASMKLAHLPKMIDGLTRAGIPASAIDPIAILELICLALYLAPRTMVLGAVLLTGYFGGAIVVHLISGESIIPVVVLGAVVWAGIYYRVPGLTSLLPFRKSSENANQAVERATVR